MAKNTKKKGSFILEIIAILILLGIIEEYFTVIIIVVVVFLILVLLYVYGSHKKLHNSNIVQPHYSQATSRSPEKEQIKRRVEILTDSINLVNDSKNLDIVLRRYNMAIDSLNKLSVYTDNEFSSLGLHLKEPIQSTLHRLEDNKIEIINQAITRNLENEITSVSKNETKIKRIASFLNKYEYNELIPLESRNFLAEQCKIYASKYLPQTYTQINSIDHTVQTLTVFDEGKYTYNIRNDNFISKFYELSSLIDSSKDINAKLDACEKSYPLLKEFCRFCIENDGGELPPLINCRDVGPEMYMRLGRWDDAERAIQICSDANAYYPDNDNEMRTYYSDYRRVAELAISYIRDNPGCLQNKMYNVLHVSEDDRETLKHFLRCSLQIKKEKSGKTNKLYLA